MAHVIAILMLIGGIGIVGACVIGALASLAPSNRIED